MPNIWNNYVWKGQKTGLSKIRINYKTEDFLKKSEHDKSQISYFGLRTEKLNLVNIFKYVSADKNNLWW